MTLHGVPRGVFVIVVVDPRAPGFGGLAARGEHALQRTSLHVGGNLQPGHIDERRGQVDVHGQRLRADARRNGFRIAHQQRRALALLVHETLVEPPVLAQEKALVGGVDDDRVVQFADLFQIIQQTPDILVDALDDGAVVLHVLLVFPARQLLLRHAALHAFVLGDARGIGPVPVRPLFGGHAVVGRLVLHDAAAPVVGTRHVVLVGVARGFEHVGLRQLFGGHQLEVPLGPHVAAYLHRLPAGGAAAARIVVQQVERLGEDPIVVDAQVTLRRHPVAVRGLVVVEHGEGTRLVAPFEKPDGLVGDDIRDVARLDTLLAVFDKQRRIVLALPHEDAPEIESLRIGIEVPLADHRRLVTGVVQQFGEGLLVTVEGARIVREAVHMAVLAREDAGPRGTRDGVGDVAVLEEHALTRQTVEVGGFDQQAAVTAHGLRGVVVGHHNDDVGASGVPLAAPREGCQRQRHGGITHPTTHGIEVFHIFRSVFSFGFRQRAAGCARASDRRCARPSRTSPGADGSARLRNGDRRPG